MRIQVGDLRRAAEALLASLRPQDRAMVVSFNSSVFLNTELTDDRFLLGAGVQRTSCGGGTWLYDAMDLLLTERFSQVAGRKMIVLFSDGVDTESRLADERRTFELAAESGASIYTIHYDTAHDIVEQRMTTRVDDDVYSLDSKLQCLMDRAGSLSPGCPVYAGSLCADGRMDLSGSP